MNWDEYKEVVESTIHNLFDSVIDDYFSWIYLTGDRYVKYCELKRDYIQTVLDNSYAFETFETVDDVAEDLRNDFTDWYTGLPHSMLVFLDYVVGAELEQLEDLIGTEGYLKVITGKLNEKFEDPEMLTKNYEDMIENKYICFGLPNTPIAENITVKIPFEVLGDERFEDGPDWRIRVANVLINRGLIL